MKTDFGQQKQNTPPQQQRGKVVVSLNPVKHRVFIDIDGNEIDPKTKRIIRYERDVH